VVEHYWRQLFNETGGGDDRVIEDQVVQMVSLLTKAQ
jgi:hypothetical protein